MFEKQNFLLRLRICSNISDIIKMSQLQSQQSETVIVDALPYIDHGYDEPGVREAALAMVEEETRRYRFD